MGGELSKGKHGGDRASGVEYVSSGNKLIKKRKKRRRRGGRGGGWASVSRGAYEFFMTQWTSG